MPKTSAHTTAPHIVILAAGMGSRLGRSLPKPLTELSDGRTIMQQQFDNIHAAFGPSARVTIVVGYKLEHIVELLQGENRSLEGETGFLTSQLQGLSEEYRACFTDLTSGPSESGSIRIQSCEWTSFSGSDKDGPRPNRSLLVASGFLN